MDKREELNAAFNDQMRKMDHYGEKSNDRNDLVGRSFNGVDYKAKIQEAQKEANKILVQINNLNSRKR